MKMQYLESLQAFVTTEIRIWDPSQPTTVHTFYLDNYQEKISFNHCFEHIQNIQHFASSRLLVLFLIADLFLEIGGYRKYIDDNFLFYCLFSFYP